MNYIKKIKSLGFKKVEPMVVCSFKNEKIEGRYLYGYKLKPLSELEKEKSRKKIISVYEFDYPKIPSQYVSKISSYLLKISEEVSLYLILVGDEYTLVVNDAEANDSLDDWYIHSNKVSIPIKSEQLFDGFWKKCLSVMDKKIQREILLRNLLK